MGSKHNAERGYLDGTVQEQTWATPNASTYKGSGPLGSDSQAHRPERCYIDAQVQDVEQRTGSLSPAFVETLMGYPIGYTEPEGDRYLRYLPRRWPAGLGAPQHEWEPPRLTTVKENRAARLKCLGNSIVPQVARLWLAAIAEEER